MSNHNKKYPKGPASGNQSADPSKSKKNRVNPQSTPQVERMETFPKTNTFPKYWDLSGMTKK